MWAPYDPISYVTHVGFGFLAIAGAAFAIRALFGIGIEIGLPFEVVVTAPIVIALLAAWYFFGQVEKGEFRT